MIAEFWKVVKTLVTLADDLQRYHSEIREIRQELRDLTIIVRLLDQEVKNSKEHSAERHGYLVLQIENRLAQLDRQLPPHEEKVIDVRPTRKNVRAKKAASSKKAANSTKAVKSAKKRGGKK